MQLEDIEIIGGDETKDRLRRDELDQLVKLWMTETYQPVYVPISRIRDLAEGVLNGLPMGKKLTSVVSGVHERLRDLFPQFSTTRKLQSEQREDSRKMLTEHLQESIDRGDMVIARKNNKAIGMVRVYKLDKVAPNQFVNGDTYEIGKALVIPQERGKGVYRELRKQAIAHVREKYGDVPILAGTKTAATKKLNRKDGWTEIGFDNYLRIYGAPDDYIDSQKEDIQLKGWTAFLYIPNREQ